MTSTTQMTILKRSHTQRRTTVGRIRLDGWSARRRELNLTTHNTHNRDIHAPGGIRTHDLSRRAAAELRLRPAINVIHICVLVSGKIFQAVE